MQKSTSQKLSPWFRITTSICICTRTKLGTMLGTRVGTRVGTKVGTNVGTRVGPRVGTRVGTKVGTRVGTKVGPNVGTRLGTRLGTSLLLGNNSITSCLNTIKILRNPCPSNTQKHQYFHQKSQLSALLASAYPYALKLSTPSTGNQSNHEKHWFWSKIHKKIALGASPPDPLSREEYVLFSSQNTVWVICHYEAKFPVFLRFSKKFENVSILKTSDALSKNIHFFQQS